MRAGKIIIPGLVVLAVVIFQSIFIVQEISQEAASITIRRPKKNCYERLD